MTYLTLSIIMPILLLSSGAALHMRNLDTTYKMMLKLVSKNITREEIYKEMTVAQGSNFTALATAAWIMLFEAIAYLYFFVPGVLPINFMKLAPELAGSDIGFFIFGVLVAMLAACCIWGLDMLPNNMRNFKISEIYSFYNISKKIKTYISLTIILLGASIIISAYLGTIYPSRNSAAELSSFLLLCLSIGILILPIWRGIE